MQKAIPKPKGGFARKIGGNSAAQDVKAYEEKVEAEKKAAVEVAEDKPAPAKEKGTAAPKRKRTPKNPKPRPIDSPPLPMEVEGPRFDFRNLTEPEKTLQRVHALLTDSRLTHGERAAAALIVYKFRGGPDSQLVKVKYVLTEDRGFSSSVRDRVIKKLVKVKLINAQLRRGEGTEITLLF